MKPGEKIYLPNLIIDALDINTDYQTTGDAPNKKLVWLDGSGAYNLEQVKTMIRELQELADMTEYRLRDNEARIASKEVDKIHLTMKKVKSLSARL